MSDIRDIFRDQSKACSAMGSPFMGRLMGLFADRLKPGTPIADHLFNWPGNPAISADNAPLRLGGALHALKLNGLALGDMYPPHEVPDDELWNAVSQTCNTHEARILNWLTRPPQTNEVQRAAAILPALTLVHDRFGLPMEMLELGTSGGLNLRADQYRLETPTAMIGPEDSRVVLTPDWTGGCPTGTPPQIKRRAGVDLAPLDPARAEDGLRLLAYIWADQPERIERTQAAFEIAAQNPAEIDAGDAAEWLEHRLATPAEDCLRFVFHTVAWQYFSEDTKTRVTVAMTKAQGPVVRFAMEADGGKGAALTLTTYPDERVEHLGRADFHGRWIEWN